MCLCSWIKNNYNNIEVIVTENGWSDEGQLDDTERIDYLKVFYNLLCCSLLFFSYLSFIFNIAGSFTGSFKCH